MKILVTGGAGFIGSNFVLMLRRERPDVTIVDVDLLTYAGNLENLASLEGDAGHVFVRADVADREAMEAVFAEHRPDGVIHFAAESHVDRSILDAAPFVVNNVLGTQVLLDLARKHGVQRYLQVSTDEVYGTLGATGAFTETTPLAPNSPYSASKAASDHLVRAWGETYGLPVVISNCSNNYGPYQYPEKLIPLMISKALAGEPLPIYGQGDNVRDWLYVDDHARALLAIIEQGRPGEVYNVGGDNELTNLEVVERICDELNTQRPRADGADYREQISFVADRPGHDKRYAIDASKLKRELGWAPRESFETGLGKTIRWYLDNPEWCASIRKNYQGERLGVGA